MVAVAVGSDASQSRNALEAIPYRHPNYVTTFHSSEVECEKRFCRKQLFSLFVTSGGLTIDALKIAT